MALITSWMPGRSTWSVRVLLSDPRRPGHRAAQDGPLLALVFKRFADALVLRHAQEHHVFPDVGDRDPDRFSVPHGLPLLFGQFDHGHHFFAPSYRLQELCGSRKTPCGWQTPGLRAALRT